MTDAKDKRRTDAARKKSAPSGPALTLIEEKKLTDEVKLVRRLAFWGVFMGFFLLILAVSLYLKNISYDNSSVKTVLLCVLAGAGALILLTALVCPKALNFLYSFLGKIVGLAGRALLDILLLITYYIFLVPLGLIQKKKRPARGFYEWEDEIRGAPESAFTPYAAEGDMGRELAGEEKKRSRRGVFALFTMLRRHGMAILIPFVILLLFIGVIFIFASSGVAQVFIYTLF